MDNQQLLAELLDLAEKLGIEVRQVFLNGSAGGLCRLRGRWVLFLDSSASLADQIGSAASALAGRADLEQRFIVPQVREILDQYADGQKE